MRSVRWQLLFCLFIGGYFPLQAQQQTENIPVMVDINVTSGIPNDPVTIYTSKIDREVFISEVWYNNLVKSEHPISKGLELTASEGNDINVTDYTLNIYRGCGSNTFAEVVLTIPLNESIVTHTSTNVVWIDLSEFSIDLVENCTNQVGISLSKVSNSKLLDFIELSTFGTMTTDVGPAAGFRAIGALGFGSSPSETYTAQLTNYGWEVAYLSPTIGEINDDLSACDFYVPRYYFEEGDIYLHTLPRDNSSRLTIGNGNNNYLYNPAQYLFFRNCANQWNSPFSEPFFAWDKYENGSDISNLQKSALTVHWGLVNTIEYFSQIHDYVFGKNNNRSIIEDGTYISYNPDGIVSSGPTVIIKDQATTNTVAHEIGHRVHTMLFADSNNPGDLGKVLNEGFADLWGTAVERFAFQLNQPAYNVTFKFGSSTTITRNLTDHTCLDCRDTGWSHADDHIKGLIIGHTHYLLNTGRQETVTNNINTTNMPVFKEIHKYICGIGPLQTDRIFFKMLEEYMNNGGEVEGLNMGFLEDKRKILSLYPYSLAAIQKLHDEGEGDTYPIFNDPDYLMAQMKNAWAAVNVGEADFQVQSPTTVQACQGNTLALSASSEEAQLIWVSPDGTQHEGATLMINNVDESHAGNYQIRAVYDSDYIAEPCTLTRNIDVNVQFIVVNEEDKTVCLNDAPFSLSITKHPDVFDISWEVPTGIAHTINNNGDLILTDNITSQHDGIYTVIAKCMLENGTQIDISDHLILQVLDQPPMATIGTLQDGAMVPGDATVCMASNVILYADDGQITWSDNNGHVIGQGTSIEVQPTTTTTYTAEVCDVMCPNLCRTNSITITVEASFIPNITGDHFFCPGEATTLGTANTYATYNWNLGSGVTSANPEVTVTEAGTYRVTVTDESGCTGSKAVIVEELAVPKPDIRAGDADAVLCPGESMALLVHNYTKYNNFVWPTGATSFFTSVNAPGTYTVTATDDQGCTATSHFTVTGSTPITPTIVASSPTAFDCEVTLSAGETASSYRWKLNGGVISGATTASITAATAGTYTLEIANEDGCSESTSISLSESDLVATEAADDLTTTIQNQTITTWTTDKVIEGVVYVRAGKILVIDGATIAFTDDQSGITLQTGGLLDIKNGATLQGNPCVEQAWRGIHVHGRASIANGLSIINYLQGQGRVRVSSGSTIRDARIGIYAPSHFDAIFSHIGGGQIEVADAFFINNLTAIYLYSYDAILSHPDAQSSFITNSQFIHYAPFLGEHTQPYTQISLGKVGQVNILGNTFKTTNLSRFSDLTDRGTGIRLTNSRIVIGEEKANANSPFSNTFEGLYTGIDVYNTMSLASVADIVNNEFDGVRHGVVLQSAPLSVVKENTFTVPTGSSSGGYDTYGILAYHSFGSEISNNTFKTGSGNSGTKGLVLQESFFETTMDEMSIYDNWFEGGFGAATEFEGNNQQVKLQCNDYVEEPRNDWYLTEDAQIDEQGECQANNHDLAFSNNWHKLPPQSGLPPNRKHIRNNSSEPVRVFYDKHSEPKWNAGLVVAQDCGDITGDEVIHSCFEETPRPDGPCGNGKPLRIAARTASTSVLRKQLECHFLSPNPIRPIKFLVLDGALSADLQDWQALTLTTNAILANPTITDEEKEVATVYNAIQLHQTSNDDATKTAQIVKLEGISPTSPMRPTAEASLALLDKRVYVRQSATIEEEGTPKTSTWNNAVVLYPNPASEYVQVQLPVHTTDPLELITIYDTKGTMVKQLEVDGSSLLMIPISDLSSGIYYCQIGQQMQKLVVLK